MHLVMLLLTLNVQRQVTECLVNNELEACINKWIWSGLVILAFVWRTERDMTQSAEHLVTAFWGWRPEYKAGLNSGGKKRTKICYQEILETSPKWNVGWFDVTNSAWLVRNDGVSNFTFVLSLSNLYLLFIIYLILISYSSYCLVIPLTVPLFQDRTVLSSQFLCSFIPFLPSCPILISHMLSPVSYQSSYFSPQKIVWWFLCNCVTTDDCRECYRNLLLVIKMCFKPRVQKSLATKFCIVAPNICGPSVWNYVLSPFWHLECWDGS
jgi:hypothetical protein